MSPLESKLRRLAASLDAAALEALASKGLLRRAQKDLERGIEARIGGETETALRVGVGEFEVTLPESGPAMARCSCPAAGVCQHILTAVLFLQREPPRSVQEPLPGINVAETPVSPDQELMTITPEQLERWAGKTAFKAGLKLASQFTPEIVRERAGARLDTTTENLHLPRPARNERGEGWGEGHPVEQASSPQPSPPVGEEREPISSGRVVVVTRCAQRAVRIRFPAMNSEVHVIPGSGLDGMIVSGGKGDGRPLIVAAVIGFQHAQGKEWPMRTEITALEASEGAPRNRAEVLASCQTLLEETLNNGLARISTANQQRWATLAVSSLGVNLPRLALSLRGIGDEAALVLARDARSDLARLLARMAQTHALCTALQQGGDSPRADWVGSHRTRYDEIGHLDLAGVAAWPWRTASGYEGLTVLFWDSSGKQWNSWTESRPRHQLADFNPVARYTQPGPWEGAESPRQLARSSFRLMNARRNPGRRLSSSSKSRVLVTGPANLQTQGLVMIEDWAQLLEQSNAQTAVGLKEANPLSSMVALRPADWGERGFDPVTQVFTWIVTDLEQHPLLLEIGFDEFTEPAIKFLEVVPPESLRGALVIGRLQRAQRGPSLHPFSIHRQNGEIIHLCLDSAKTTAAKPGAVHKEEEEAFEDEEETESAEVFSPVISRLLDEVDDGLLALAEAGLATPSPLRVDRVRQVAPRAERLGLRGLTAGLGNVVDRPQPRAVLRCAYLSQLHRRALPLST